MKKAESTDRPPSIHFRISPDEYRYLQSVAEKTDRPESYLIAQIVREWIDKSRGGPKSE